jgi:hypothetical protein
MVPVIMTIIAGGCHFYYFFLFAPDGPGLNREVHPVTPGISGAYYPAGEKEPVRSMMKRPVCFNDIHSLNHSSDKPPNGSSL